MLCAACGGDGSPREGFTPLTADLPVEGGVLRVPRGGGTPILLHSDSLTEVPWRFAGTLPALERPLGVDRDDHTAYFVTAKGSLLGIDLDARNAQVRVASARQLVAGTDGFVFGLDSSRRPLRFANRTLTRYRGKVAGGTLELFRAPGGTVSIYSASERVLQVLNDEGEVRRFEVPSGAATASWFGDMVAIADDSGLTLVRQSPSRNDVTFTRVKGSPKAATFSPSGHRIYVALGTGDIAIVDGFGDHRTLGTIGIGRLATRLRTDRSGRWLMAGPPQGDSVWVVDLAREEVVARLGTTWRDDLPQINEGRSLLVRSGQNVAGYSLAGDTPVRERLLEGAADDFFVPVYWLPPRRNVPVVATAPAPDSTRPDTSSRGTGTAAAVEEPAKGKAGEAWYLQVSSSQNPDFAKTLADQLTEAGYPARVLPPETAEQGHRVILGPYPSHDAADAIGKKLGRAYFVMPLTPQND